ncbi:MAG: pantetheine-phosphate adenylyltransferase [Acholeplasmataceae bacterium]|jgi:pantetheine-phosphate adenylyltransferase
MKKAIFPGSFDPLTNGHLDLIKRASQFVDKLYILIADNVNKKTIFTVDERIEMIKLVTKDIPNVEIAHTERLIVEFARENNINLIIRGLRNLLDYVSEYQLYSFNKKLNPNVETFIMFPSSDMHFISSSAIKELIYHNADITPYVPHELVNIIVRKYQQIIK